MDGVDAVDAADAIGGVRRDRGGGGQHHERGDAGRRLADVHVGDVDAGVAEHRADRADHPGRSSLRTTSMCGDGGTSTVWSSTITMRGSPFRPDERAGQRVVAAAHGDEVDVVVGGGGRRLAHLDAALGRRAAAR